MIILLVNYYNVTKQSVFHDIQNFAMSLFFHRNQSHRNLVASRAET